MYLDFMILNYRFEIYYLSQLSIFVFFRYIDYLIHENEDVTQISRAFSLPVNLYQSPDFYFMDSLKKKVCLPSFFNNLTP